MRRVLTFSLCALVASCRAPGLATPPDANDATNPDAPIGKAKSRPAIDASAFDNVKLGGGGHSGHSMHGHAGHTMPKSKAAPETKATAPETSEQADPPDATPQASAGDR